MRLYGRLGYVISKGSRREKFWEGNGLTRKVIRLLWAIREIMVVLAKDFPKGKTTEIYIKTNSYLGHPLT